MLVGPCRVSAGLVNDAEDGVGADEIPRVNGTAAFAGVADKSLGIDGGDAAVGQRRAGRATVDFGLVDVDAFFILGGGASRGRVRGAGAGREAVTSGLCGGVKIPGIGDVVVDAGQGGASTGDDRDQAGEGIRWF